MLSPFGVDDQVAQTFLQSPRANQPLTQRVQNANYQTEQQNTRAAAVLRDLSGVDLPSDPRRWWQWWQAYVDQHPEIRYRAHVQVTSTLATAPAALEKHTPVWSQTGKVPIHTLQIGDLVLAHDPATGHTVYKPVIGISRSVQRLYGVKLSGGDWVQCSAGCVFWKNRSGWWQARDLNEQSHVRGLSHHYAVTEIRQLSVGEVFDLEVADFNNLIIGEQGVLVHDRTRPKPVAPPEPVAAHR